MHVRKTQRARRFKIRPGRSSSHGRVTLLYGLCTATSAQLAASGVQLVKAGRRSCVRPHARSTYSTLRPTSPRISPDLYRFYPPPPHLFVTVILVPASVS